jgi:hypothetical protein
MNRGKVARYGALDSTRTLGCSRLQLMELQIIQKSQITNLKYQINLNDRNSNFQTVLVIEYRILRFSCNLVLEF